jgi:predicted 2-oxoglutarate/Fe(II)-dependent dioxygenase YbiX/peroxiredoxin
MTPARPSTRLTPRFTAGDPVPWFTVRSSANPEYHFSSVAGRHIVLLFAGALRTPLSAAVHAAVLAQRQEFDDDRASLFVVSIDPDDEATGRARELLPGVRVFWDDGARISADFGVASPLDATGSGLNFVPAALLLDPTLRVVRWFVPTDAQPDFSAALLDAVAALPVPLRGPALQQAPVVIVPRIFEPAFCRQLIAHYEQHGGEDSGYMKTEGGVVVGVIDHNMKRRSDCLIEDEPLRLAVAARIRRRLRPELQRVFRFDATRMERYLVACYDGADGGFFRPHRDNEGDGHRQFAVTLNLNAEDYEGGDLRFPEYGLQTYRAPTGGACVFSCGLMHEATPVTRGRRYAFLPFLYDEASARQREANNARLADASKHYKAGPADKNDAGA